MRFKSFNIINKTISTENILTLSPKNVKFKSKKRILTGPFCYIPRFTSSMLSIDKQQFVSKYYDCILATMKFGYYSFETKISPCFIIFDADNGNKCRLENIQTSFGVYNRNHPVSPSSYLYCGDHDKHGIIVIFDVDKLFQIKLQNQCKFSDLSIKMLKQTNKLWNFDDSLTSLEYKLKAHYLSKYESIFVARCWKDNWDMSRFGDAFNLKNNLISTFNEFGLFNLNTLQWTKIADFEYTTSFNTNNFNCGMCNDYNQNNVYMICNTGITSRYDFNKNKWFDLYDDINYNQMAFDVNTSISMWCDDYNPNILYCVAMKNRTKSTLKYFDMRNDKKKWNVIPFTKEYGVYFKAIF